MDINLNRPIMQHNRMIQVNKNSKLRNVFLKGRPKKDREAQKNNEIYALVWFVKVDKISLGNSGTTFL